MSFILFIQICLLGILFFCVIFFPLSATTYMWIKEKRFVVFLYGSKIPIQSERERRLADWEKKCNAISQVCISLYAISLLVELFSKGK